MDAAKDHIGQTKASIIHLNRRWTSHTVLCNVAVVSAGENFSHLEETGGKEDN